MSIIDSTIRAVSFKDTIFLKESSDLEDRYNALRKLSEEYPNNELIGQELYIVKKGLDGEKEIEYQLKKSNLGMYVLHDVNLEYEDMRAQVDYILVTKLCCYFVECKNLVGNITVDEKGNFMQTFKYKNKMIQKGLYSPIRQADEHRTIYKKIRDSKLNWFKRTMSENSFPYYHRLLVVAANNETILSTRYAPNDIKNKIVKADALVRKIQYDLDNSDTIDWGSQKVTEDWAKSFLKLNVEKIVDYYQYYKEKFVIDDNNQKADINNDLKERLINFRKERSKEMGIPAYYVFTNEELDKILELKPKTIDELNNILSPIKMKTHGEQIIKEIRKN